MISANHVMLHIFCGAFVGTGSVSFDNCMEFQTREPPAMKFILSKPSCPAAPVFSFLGEGSDSIQVNQPKSGEILFLPGSNSMDGPSKNLKF